MPAGSSPLPRLSRRYRRRLGLLAGAAVLAAAPALAAPEGRHAGTQVAPAKATAQGTASGTAQGTAQGTGQPNPDAMRIVAVVNGDVITNADIDYRARLFAMSTGLPMSPEILGRLRPQILRQLVDERLRMQEAQKRKIVIQDQQIADAIKEIEQHNGMQPSALRARLTQDGVSFRTLVDQIRAQLAWTEVLRQQMAERGPITPAEVADRQKLLTQMVGQPQFRLSEIFIPVDDPANAADAQRFAETVITQLHSGAAFPIVAAQFSQTQNALEGGDLGWVQANELDSAVAALVPQMPPGAISNPVRVPGGFEIVQLRGKREIGRETGTALTVRQAFLPFSSPLTDPQQPTDQQRQTLTRSREIAATVHGCDAMEQYAKANKLDSRPIDPGEIRLEAVNPPQFRQLLAAIPIGKASEPLVSREGISVMMVCSREEKTTSTASTEEVERMLISDRVELLSRQLMRDLHRQANIDLRGNGV